MPQGANLLQFVNLYIAFNASLLLFSGYIFFRVTPDVMKTLEYRCFKGLILFFQLYLTLETVQTLQEYELIRLPNAVYAAVCFASLLSAVFNAMFFYLTLVLRIETDDSKSILSFALGSLPLFSVITVLTVSLYNGMIFSIDAGGHLIKGDMYYLLHVFSAMYFVALSRFAIYKARKLKTIKAKREAINVTMLVVFLIAWIEIDDLFKGTTILLIAIFGVIAHIFVSSQQANIYTDMLTGMHNRRKAEVYLSNELNTDGDTPLYMFMGDINGFKQINDKYGHHEGDSALVIFAEAIKKSAAAYDGFAARYGGDEFVWAWRPVRGGDFDPEMVISDIRHRVAAECTASNKPYMISLAIGYVVCDDAKRPISSYLKEADKKMYSNKEGHYRLRKQ